MVSELIAKNANIEIDGFQFVAEEITATESYPRRELIRTAIMGGGQQTSKGQYVPRTYSFTASVDYTVAQPDEYDALWSAMENKNCNVICQYTGNFVSEVKIDKVYPKGSLNNVKITVTLTEISQANNTATVKTDNTDWTTITDNSISNIKTGTDKDGNTITVQTNVSDKFTTEASKKLKKITKVKKDTTTSKKTSTMNTETNVAKDVVVTI